MLYINFSVNCLKFVPLVVDFLFSACFGGHFFVTIAQVKVKLIPDLYIWAIVLIIKQEEICRKQFLTFGLIGVGGGKVTP